MKYALLIHHGDTANPDDPEAWGELSEDQQKQIFADYQAINQTPGVTPNEFRLGPPDAATTVRVQDGKTLTTDGPFVSVKEAVAGWLAYEADDLDAAIELACASRPPGWVVGSRSGRSSRGDHPREVFRDAWGRVLASLIGFLGSFELAEEAAQEAFAIAAERWPREACRTTRAHGW